MAGKAKINNTAYTISGGKTKINGTSYQIGGGITKVGGTQYAISFGRLPSGFQEVEWIASSGSQYILTDILTSSIIGNYTEIVFEMLAAGGSQWDILAGSGVNGSSFFDIVCSRGSSTITLQPLTSSGGYELSYDYSSHPKKTVKYYFTSTQGTVYVDGVSVYTGTVDSSKYSNIKNTPFSLFCRYTTEQGATAYATGKIYSFSIGNNGSYVCNFVPCYCTTTVTAYKGSTETTASAGTIGLFDLVNKRFYINSGSGTFTKGADV